MTVITQIMRAIDSLADMPGSRIDLLLKSISGRVNISITSRLMILSFSGGILYLTESVTSFLCIDRIESEHIIFWEFHQSLLSLYCVKRGCELLVRAESCLESVNEL